MSNSNQQNDSSNDTDDFGTGMKRESDQTKLLAVCTDCEFVVATHVNEDYQGTEDDPALRHHIETDHGVGSFEPVEDSPLDDQWQLAHAGDWDDLLANEDLMDLATGVEE